MESSRPIDYRDIIFKRVTSPQLISNKPCWLYSLHSRGTSTGNGRITLYNSYTGYVNPIIDLSVKKGYIDNAIFEWPVFFSKGIYLFISYPSRRVTCIYVPVY